MLKIALLMLIFSFPQILFAEVCETEEPYGVSLTQLESQFSETLSVKNYNEMYLKAEVLGVSRDRADKIAALLLLHKIQDNSVDPEELVRSLVLLSKQRDAVTYMLEYNPYYKCNEFRAARDYVNRYPLGYQGTELWGGWFYEPDNFIEESAKKYTKENKLKVKYLTYQEVDPCSPFEYSNSCYAPIFSKIANESQGMSFWQEALITATVFNLNLSVCDFAGETQNALGLSAALKHIQTLKTNFPNSEKLDKVYSLLELRQNDEYKKKIHYSLACRRHP